MVKRCAVIGCDGIVVGEILIMVSPDIYSSVCEKHLEQRIKISPNGEPFTPKGNPQWRSAGR